MIIFPSLVNCDFWSSTHSFEYLWSSQSLSSDRTGVVSSSNCTVTNRFRSWTKTGAYSCVCALHHWQLVPQCTFATYPTPLSSVDFWSSCALTLMNRLRIPEPLVFLKRTPTSSFVQYEKRTKLGLNSSVCKYVSSSPTLLCKRILCVRFHHVIFPRIWASTNFAHEAQTLG